MDRVRFGGTGMEISVAALGTGGASRIGQGSGQTEAQSLRLLERAFDLGVTYVDTAPSYGTERLVGKAIARRGGAIHVSTKAFPGGRSHPLITEWGGDSMIVPRADEFALLSASELRTTVEGSLRTLECDAIDVFHIHAVTPDLYDHVVAELVPELLALRDEGAIRFLALSEFFAGDPSHQTLSTAVEDDCWDVFMVGFNLLNPSARHRVLDAAQARDIGVEVMGAARGGFTSPARLRSLVRTLVAQGHLSQGTVDLEDPLGFLLGDGGAESLLDAAYRFCRHEPGCHVVLTGTGSIEHLEANVRSINRGPLPDPALRELHGLFGHLDHVRLGH